MNPILRRAAVTLILLQTGDTPGRTNYNLRGHRSEVSSCWDQWGY